MRKYVLAVAVLGSLAAGCADHGESSTRVASSSPITSASHSFSLQAAATSAHRLASSPDRGSFVEYERHAPATRRGAYTAYPVRISEAHAVRAIAQGGMVIEAPDGRPVKLQYTGSIQHADGNWTWVGHPAGSPAGTEALLTFGDKAVFGTIPTSAGELQVTTLGGRTWMLQPDPHAVAASGADPVPTEADALRPMLHGQAARPAALAAQPRPVAVQSTTAQAAGTSPTVDVVLGYTTGFATRLGGQSQAVTRLQYLVDLTNQAYADSQVAGRIRMVAAVQVGYADNTSNQATLFELSGLSCSGDNSSGLRTPDAGESCTSIAVPDALKPLINARDRYGADLVSLVRNYTQPENGSCGVAWLLGAGQAAITSADAPYGVSVVSDSGGTAFPSQSTTCREEYLAHELGHNMGLQHDRETAAGTDDTNGDATLLDPEEFGAFPYAFGYSSSTGNFYTIMSLRRSGQTGYKVFSNPNITVCGGSPCGEADKEDNARALNQTMSIVAAFRTATVGRGVWFSGDFNADGKSDVLWRNVSTGGDVIWRSAISSTQQAVAPVSDQAWQVAGVADFDGDGKADMLWRNSATGADQIWKSANAQTKVLLPTVALTWSVAGVGDFNGDGKGDILWRSTSDGSNVVWLSGSPQTKLTLTAVTDQAWVPVGTGDFDADGKDDILWRNANTGGNVVWRSASSKAQLVLTTVADGNWTVAGVGDFNADGHADILWRNQATGANVLWKSANSKTQQALATVADLNWGVAAVGDFNGDGQADIAWRNASTGHNEIWRSANPQTKQAMTTVADLNWHVVG